MTEKEYGVVLWHVGRKQSDRLKYKSLIKGMGCCGR